MNDYYIFYLKLIILYNLKRNRALFQNPSNDFHQE